MKTKGTFKEFMLKTPTRIAVCLFIPSIGLLGLWFLYHFTSPFPCVFYQVTHLYCPGCGSGRAAYDLIHLNLREAFGHNVFFMIVLPFIGYYLVKVYLEYLFQRHLLPFFRIRYKVGMLITISIVLYWIVRNIPVQPFCYLAP